MTIQRDLSKYDEQALKDAERWTEIDGDLDGVDPSVAAAILTSRCETIRYDHPRTERWHDPEGVDVIEDIPYLPDGGYDAAAGQVRGHLLDIYLPHEAAVRMSNVTPVYVDVHGGGFCYGYKELNRNFNTHLAAQGFAVVSLNYRPAPQTDLKGQLADVQAALRWLKAHLADYPVDPNAVFITGDSAGGALALLTLAIENSGRAAEAYGTERKNLESTLGPGFFAGLDAADPDFLTAPDIVANVDLPPLFLLTSADDFIQAETLALATALARKGTDFELHDWKPARHDSLGHVFPVCMTWREESLRTLADIRRFSYDRC